MKKRAGKGFLIGVLVVIGLLLCLNTLFAYRYSTDLNLGVVLPALLGIICFLAAAKLGSEKEPIIRSKRLRTLICSVTVVCFLFFAVVEGLIIIDPYTHRSELAGHVDYVVVLGCGIWPDGDPTLALIMRLDKALEYYRKNPHSTLIVSGGQGPGEPFPEAVAMEKYLLNRGVPPGKIIKESQSTSTRENFEFSRRLIKAAESEKVRIVFVTNDFHVLRSRILAERFGFEAFAIPAPTPAVILVSSYLREFFAFVKSMAVDY